MAGAPRKPMSVQESKRRVHRSTAEKEARRESEEAIRCPISGVDPPEYLEDERERSRFIEIAQALHSTDPQLITALDTDQLARYVQRERDYLFFKNRLAQLKSQRKVETKELAQMERLVRGALSDVQSCASALGLNVSSRLKLDLRKPEPDDEDEFSQFE